MFAGARFPNISRGKISKCTPAARTIVRDLPRIPLTQRQEYTPREDVIKYVRRPGRIRRPRIHMCHTPKVSYMSVRERLRRVWWLPLRRRRTASIRTPPVTNLDSRRRLDRLDRLDRFVTRSGVSRTEKIQAPSSNFDSPGSFVTRNRQAFR